MIGAGDRLWQRMRERGPLCVGIDPHPELLRSWGLDDDVAGLERFALTVVEALAGEAAVIKPQVALFERQGAAGLAVLERVVAQTRGSGTEIIADAKRGDIGSTMAAYADAWLGERSPLAGEWVTLSPYLGFESLRPALDRAGQTGKGAFVLALTSNPEGQTVQHRGAPAVAAEILRAACAENARSGAERVGHCGLVIGATIGNAAEQLQMDLSSFNGLILAPGFGAQGAGVQQLRQVFSGVTDQVVVSSSRAVLAQGPSVAALRAEARQLNEQLGAELS